MKGTRRPINIKLALLLVIGGLALAMMVMSGSALATITGDSPPTDGDWTINNPTSVTGETIWVNGSIIIKNTLTVDRSTIIMNVTSDNDIRVWVTNLGDLKVTDSTFTSLDLSMEYGFEVRGKMNVKDSVLAECHEGIQILTNTTVMIVDTTILNSTGRGLYLKDANGTTIKNVNIHSDDFGRTLYYNFDVTTNYQYNYTDVYAGVILHIDGGNPIIDGVDMSVNGTVNVETYTTRSVYRNYMYFYVYYIGVIIESKEFTELSGIAFHDSDLSMKITHRIVNTYYYAYSYYRTYCYYKGCMLTDFKNMTLGGFDVVDVKTSYPSVSVSRTGSYMRLYPYSYYYPMEMFYAMVNGDFSTAGPHDLRINLKDAKFESTSILSFTVEPTYSGSVTPTFNVELMVDNVTLNGSSGGDVFTFRLYPRFAALKIFNVDITFKDSNFTNLTNRLIYAYYYRGTGLWSDPTFELEENFVVEGCTFENCTISNSELFYTYSSASDELNNRYDRMYIFRNNTFENNSCEIMYLNAVRYMSKGQEQLFIEDNTFIGTGEEIRYYSIYVSGFERITIQRNEFKDMHYYYCMQIYDYGGSRNGVKPGKFWILNNTFENCQNTYDYYYYNGVVRFYGAGTLEVADNYIADCGMGFLNLAEYTYYNDQCLVDFHHNQITNVSKPIIWMSGYSAYHKDLVLDIHDNVAWNCSGSFVDYYRHYYLDTYNYDAKITFTDNEITNFTGVVFSCYGDMTVTDNTISECKDYVFELRYLNLQVPTIARNNISDCVDVYLISAKERGALRVSITMSDLEVKCTGNAFRFENVDMTMMNVNISDDVELAIIAQDSDVDLVDSLLPVGSGRIIGDGSINVWFNIEANVHWANNMGEDSHAPVPEAMLIFEGMQGLYYTSSYTNEEGRMRPKRILNWEMDGPFVTRWSPYTVTIAKSGMTNITTLELDRSYVGENAATFLLWDNSDPFIRLVSPFPGILISTENLTVRGFATELGSGIAVLNISIDGMEPVSLELDDNGDFSHTFHYVPEGDVVITAMVEDVATNTHFSVLSVRIDRTPPSLRILDPSPGYVTNVNTVQVRAEIEEGAVVVINEEEWGISPGSISVDFPLSEGVNSIIIRATDEAGNVALEVTTVFLDTIEPSLSLFAPRDMSLTRMTNVIVEGEAEVGSTVTISVNRTDTNLVDEIVTPDEDGMFSHGVDLSEGVNEITVKAVDGAGNEMLLKRTVIVDTTAPDCGIDEPVDGYMTNAETVTVKGWAEAGDVLVYLNGKQIFSTGTIERIVRLHEGENIITLSAVDTIGNENSHSIKVYMDSTAPVIQISTPVETSILTNIPTIRFIGIIVGDHEGMTANGEEVVVENGVFDILVPVTHDMRSSIVLVAYDQAGNKGLYTVDVDHSTALPPIGVEFTPGGKVIRTADGNLYITGVTTDLVKEVEVVHESDLGNFSHTYSVSEALFSMVLALEKGDNSVVLKVTDIYGNTNTTTPYEVEYDPPKVVEDEDNAVSISPQNLGLVLLVIAITLFITAVIVTRGLKVKRQE